VTPEMSALRACVLRLGGFFGRERRDRDLADELESHVKMHIEESSRGTYGCPNPLQRRCNGNTRYCSWDVYC
jgi:hypothetical protein